MNLPPDGAIALHRKPGLVRRIETDDVKGAARRALGAVGRVHAVPDRRMRLLQRLELHGDAAEGKSPAFEVEYLLGQPLNHQLDCLSIDLLRVLRIGAVVFKLDRRSAAPEAELQPSAAQLVQHADFLDQPQGMMERHRPHQRPEPQASRALGDSGKKHARRGRHAERRRMVLGDMIGVEPGAVVGLGYFETVLVIVRKRAGISVEVIEDAEFHYRSAFRWADRTTPPYFFCFRFFFRCASVRSRNALSRMNPSASRWS